MKFLVGEEQNTHYIRIMFGSLGLLGDQPFYSKDLEQYLFPCYEILKMYNIITNIWVSKLYSIVYRILSLSLIPKMMQGQGHRFPTFSFLQCIKCIPCPSHHASFWRLAIWSMTVPSATSNPLNLTGCA